MELFAVKRYDEGTFEHSEEKEEKILNKLLQKAEKRKKKLTRLSNENEISNKIAKLDNQVIYENDQLIISDDITPDKKSEEPVIDENVTEIQKNEENAEFTVLNPNNAFRKKKNDVQVVLPVWLAHPTVISTDISKGSQQQMVDDASFLSDKMKSNLRTMKIEHLFPVQSEVIPWILKEHSKPSPLKPRDVCVSAPTGSGKTLAFALPIVELLSKRVKRKIRALIVLPVNELAHQVSRVFRMVVQQTSLGVCFLSKTVPFADEQRSLVEFRNGIYYSKVDIVITTPGRLVEHLHATKGFCLKSLQFLVIDEADRIMDQIHHNWLYHLDTHVKNTSDMLLGGRPVGLRIIDLEGEAQRQPHKLLFSATLSQDPEKLQNLKLFQPKMFTSVVQTAGELKERNLPKLEHDNKIEMRGEFIGKYTTPAELTEKYCITENKIKPLTLFSLIKQNQWKKFLCFTNSVDGAHRLAFVLRFLFSKTLEIAELSANLPPKSRSEILKKFALGKVNGIVCSDALSRGIDIPQVDVVISYDVPRHINTHIHRIGRTARAGQLGTAITLLNEREMTSFKNVLAEAGKEPTDEIQVTGTLEEEFAKRYARALKSLQTNLNSERYFLSKKKIAAKQKNVEKQKLPSEMTLMEKLQMQASATS